MTNPLIKQAKDDLAIAISDCAAGAVARITMIDKERPREMATWDAVGIFIDWSVASLYAVNRGDLESTRNQLVAIVNVTLEAMAKHKKDGLI